MRRQLVDLRYIQKVDENNKKKGRTRQDEGDASEDQLKAAKKEKKKAKNTRRRRLSVEARRTAATVPQLGPMTIRAARCATGAGAIRSAAPRFLAKLPRAQPRP